MNLYVGTSGYSYKEWKGTFYPKDLPVKQMLRFYAERLRTVEINSTFYGMPKASVLESWAAAVSADFKFVLKAPKWITHVQRLKDADDLVASLLEVAGALTDRLGPLFGDDLFKEADGEGLDVDGIGRFGIGHDGRRVGVDQHHRDTFFAQ